MQCLEVAELIIQSPQRITYITEVEVVLITPPTGAQVHPASLLQTEGYHVVTAFAAGKVADQLLTAMGTKQLYHITFRHRYGGHMIRASIKRAYINQAAITPEGHLQLHSGPVMNKTVRIHEGLATKRTFQAEGNILFHCLRMLHAGLSGFCKVRL